MEWIKVKDKKPNLKEEVIVYWKQFNQVTRGKLHKSFGSYIWYVLDEFELKEEEITHWSEYPEPPKP